MKDGGTASMSTSFSRHLIRLLRSPYRPTLRSSWNSASWYEQSSGFQCNYRYALFGLGKSPFEHLHLRPLLRSDLRCHHERAGPFHRGEDPWIPHSSPSSSEWHHLRGLSEEQLMAVQAPSGAVRVVAGPGSGKTRVLTARIAHLMATQGARPWEILAITFTNKAAREIRERLASSSTAERAANVDRIFAGTFHSLCYRVLRQALLNLPGTGRGADWIVYDQDASLSLMVKLIRAKEPDEIKGPEIRTKAKSIHSRISRIKNGLVSWHGLSAEEAVFKYYFERKGLDLNDSERAAATELSSWFQSYEDALREANAVDFDDLLGYAVALLRHDSQLLARFRRKYKYILIDEFQDTNSAQYELVRLLTGMNAILTAKDFPTACDADDLSNDIFVVGDPDQAIYGWRGAEVSYMRTKFLQDFAENKVYRLRDNYRSTLPILSSAQEVIRHIEDRERLEFVPRRGGGPSVEIRRLEDAYREADYIVEEAESLLKNKTCRESDIAVLVRTHAQTRPIEQRFVQKGIPYVLVGSISFWRRIEIQDLMAYLRLAVTLQDDVAFERIVNVPKRGLGEASIQKIKEAAQQRKMKISEMLFGSSASVFSEASKGSVDKSFQALTKSSAPPPLPCRREMGLSPKAAASLDAFRTIVWNIRTAIGCKPLDQALVEMIDLVGYKDHVVNGHCGTKDQQDIEERFQRISQLISRAAEFKSAGMIDLGIGDEQESDKEALEDERRGLDSGGAPAFDGMETREDAVLSTLIAGQANSSDQSPAQELDLSKKWIHQARCFMDEAALTSSADEGENAAGVRLMTMHAAKGLEFEAVFIPGCNEGMVPLHSAHKQNENNIEEETRLFFVSMTRACRILRLSHTRWNVMHGMENKRPCKPSRFLARVMQSGHAIGIDDAWERDGCTDDSKMLRRSGRHHKGGREFEKSYKNSSNDETRIDHQHQHGTRLPTEDGTLADKNAQSSGNRFVGRNQRVSRIVHHGKEEMPQDAKRPTMGKPLTHAQKLQSRRYRR